MGTEQITRLNGRENEMKQPDEVAAMLRLKGLGWGYKRIALEFGVSPNTVRKWLREGGWRRYERPRRSAKLDGREEWLRERFLKHRGNADVVRQELAAEGVLLSLRTVERAVEGYRRELRVEADATVRFETPPGRQLQVDFTECHALIEGQRQRIQLCVLTLGYSRRIAVFSRPSERQAEWLLAIEAAFARFGVPEELLVDNARALVHHHDVETRQVQFNTKFLAFCKHWAVRPVACAPYRAQTKGKVERSCGYVKRNAIAGREFASWEALQTWLDCWCGTVADVRVHGTIGEAPLARFEREEASQLREANRPSFLTMRELQRRVGPDHRVEIDTNRYTVPYVHIGRTVVVRIQDEALSVFLATGECVARHRLASGRHRDVVDPAHLQGIARSPLDVDDIADGEPLARALSVYEAAAGGAL
jgi:transposase